MTSVLGAVQNFFTTALFFGYLFPSVIYLFVWAAVLSDVADVQAQVWMAKIVPWEKDSASIGAVFAVVLLTALLQGLNASIIRLYAGYPWKDSFLGKWRVRRHRRRYDVAATVVARARNLRYELNDLVRRQASSDLEKERLKSDHQFFEMHEQKLIDLQLPAQNALSDNFPPRRDVVLPTRFGNKLRAIEQYSEVRYGFDGVVFWPRLVPLLSPALRNTIDHAKTFFDFMINCSFLGAITAVIVLVIGLYRQANHAQSREWLYWVVGFAALAWLMYELALTRLAEWGSGVRAAYDLHRLDLLNALGYKAPIVNRSEERLAWDELTYQTLWPAAPNRPELPYSQVSPWVTVEPSNAVVSINRRVRITSIRSRRVMLSVSNDGKARVAAKRLIIRDAIPAGFRLASVSSLKEMRVANLDPLELHIEPDDPAGCALNPSDKRAIEYTLVRSK